jgi:Tol biopolymer transport system component
MNDPGDAPDPGDDPGDEAPASVAWMRIAGNGDSVVGDLSADGSRLAFTSQASDLVAGDTNEAADAFVLGRLAMEIDRVSVATDGAEALGPKNKKDRAAWVTSPQISADGETVSFVSLAGNLVEGDTNAAADLFVHRMAGETLRANVSTDGREADWDAPQGDLSGDGRYVTFYSHAESLVEDAGCVGVYLHDSMMGITSLESETWEGDPDTGCSYWGDGEATISADGSALAFSFGGGELIEDLHGDAIQIYVRGRTGGGSELISVNDEGDAANAPSAGPQLSSDGLLVAFRSEATNLSGADENAAADIFVRNRLDGVTELVSVSSDGEPADAGSTSHAMSADGRFVVFVSEATNLVADDDNGVADVFVRDLQTGETARVSAPVTGGDADGASVAAVISGNGRVIAFSSAATNLMSGDDNGAIDLFIAPNPFQK